MSCSCCVSVSTKLHGHSDTEVSVVTTNIMHTSTMCYKHHFDPKIFSEDVLGFIDISIFFSIILSFVIFIWNLSFAFLHFRQLFWSILSTEANYH